MIYTKDNQEEYEQVNFDELWTLINAYHYKEYMMVIASKCNLDANGAYFDMKLSTAVNFGMPVEKKIVSRITEFMKKPEQPKGALVIIGTYLTSNVVQTILNTPKDSPIFAFIGEKNNFTKKHLALLESHAIVYQAKSIEQAVEDGFMQFKRKAEAAS